MFNMYQVFILSKVDSRATLEARLRTMAGARDVMAASRAARVANIPHTCGNII